MKSTVFAIAFTCVVAFLIVHNARETAAYVGSPIIASTTAAFMIVHPEVVLVIWLLLIVAVLFMAWVVK